MACRAVSKFIDGSACGVLALDIGALTLAFAGDAIKGYAPDALGNTSNKKLDEIAIALECRLTYCNLLVPD